MVTSFRDKAAFRQDAFRNGFLKRLLEALFQLKIDFWALLFEDFAATFISLMQVFQSLAQRILSLVLLLILS